jgi:hypothetical protein
MRKGELSKLVSAAARILLAFLFLFSQSAWAAQNQKAKDKAVSPQKTVVQQPAEKQSAAGTTAKARVEETQGEQSEGAVAGEKPSGDGSHEGIKVHGHWTIEVRNPDGTLVTHREFENSYVGGSFLPALLNHQSVASPSWFVAFGDTPNNIGRVIVESQGLTVQVPTSGANAGKFVLSGSRISYLITSIAFVGTFATIGNGSASPFTGTTLSPPIPISDGQIVQVTVVISFS